MKAYWVCGCIAPCILDLGTGWKWIVRFRPRPLNPEAKFSCNQYERRLGVILSLNGYGGEKIHRSCRDSNP
jgi:hypothetical protein